MLALRIPAVLALTALAHAVPRGAAPQGVAPEGRKLVELDFESPLGALVRDADGDGLPDFVRGEATPGGPAGALEVLSSSSGAVLLTVTANGQWNAFGGDLVVGPDVDGDGTLDYLVGAPDSCAVQVISGATGATIRSLDWSGACTNATATALRFGQTLHLVDDQDGDGVQELLVAQTPGMLGNTGTGGLYLMSLVTGATLVERVATPADGMFAAALDVVRHPSTGEQEVVVGVPYAGGVGAVRLLSLPTLSLRLEIPAPSTGSTRFGFHAAGVSDVDGDGIEDVAISDTFGGPGASGHVGVYSGLDGQLLWGVDGSFQSLLGWGLGNVGDVDGDGIDDVVTGLRQLSPGPRRMRVFSGVDGAERITVMVEPPWLLDAYFVFDEALPAGDFDGDGFDDAAVWEDGKVVVASACTATSSIACTSLPNSTGSNGRTRACHLGDRLQLLGEGVPPNEPGFFVLAGQVAMTPLGSGVLCVPVGASPLDDGTGPIVFAGPDGVARTRRILADLPGGDPFQPGGPVVLQFVHRDRIGGTPTVGTADAVQLDL